MSESNTMNAALLNSRLTEEGVFIITLDLPNETMNVLRRELIDEFNLIFDEIDNDQNIKSVVFTSAKEDNFIAGADIAMIEAAESSEQAADLAHQLQLATQRVEKCSKTTVAAIHGACLGGGLELAMAFDYRIASSHAKSKFGLPEVQLGLLPGGSGTQRLPRLVGLPASLDLILTGKQIDSRRAKRMGLVDDVVAPSILMQVAEKFARKGKTSKRKLSLQQRAMSSVIGRGVVFRQARKRTLAKTQGNYPAPLKIMDVIETGLSEGFEAGLSAERNGFGELAMTSESAELWQLFFATTELKKDTGIDNDKVVARQVNKVGVLGAGLMGAGIAYVSIKNASVTTRMKDRDNQGLSRGISYVNRILNGRVKRRRMQTLQKRQIQARLSGSIDYSGFKDADIIVEAVFEDLALKQTMLQDVENLTDKKDIIFATNTSAIPIADIAAKTKQPEKVIGMHYFSPVEKMPLLEIITAKKTADWVTATCVEFGKRQGKTVIVVNDGPGFYTTRILGPYMMEAIHMVTEGVEIAVIDNALHKFGFPVGPIVLLDEVGIDVASHIADTLHTSFGDRAKPVAAMQNVITDGRKGRKNKRGFYSYSDEKSKDKAVDLSIYPLLGVADPGSKQLSDDIIADRCVLQMVNEAVYCLDEKILRSARDGDIGAVFGLGFPPFLGGPFRYADSQGLANVVARLEALEADYGERYKPAPLLVAMAEKGERFYSE